MTAAGRAVGPDTFLDALAGAGYRLTGPRRALASLVATWDGHFTAADLVAAARSRRLGIGRATIFRALELFASLGLVERVDLPDGGHAYVGCTGTHHHHAICTTCGRSIAVGDLALPEMISELGRRSGFRVASHRLELFGTCPECAAGRATR